MKRYTSGGPSVIRDIDFINNNSATNGGALLAYSDTEIINCNFLNNNAAGDGSAIYTGRIVNARGSNFIDNGQAVYNGNIVNVLDFSNNYWGSASGPYHPNQNPSGLGDSTNIFINVVTPWLNEPSTTAPPIPVSNVLITDNGSGFVSLSWEASHIGDLAGYKIYYDTDDEDFPYRFSVDVGNITTHTINNFINNGRYFFAVVAYDNDGNESWFTKANESVYLATKDVDNVPMGFTLSQNHPNPFNPSTTITYSITEESVVTINIYDLVGRQISHLGSSKQPSGTHSIQWNGTDQQGNSVPAGIYFYQLQAGDFVQTKKMVLMK